MERPAWLMPEISMEARNNHRLPPTAFDDEIPPPPPSFRLFNETYPYHYQLYFNTNIHNGTFPFEGNTRIYIKVNNQTNRITLNSFLINIQDVKVQAVYDNWPEVPVTNFESIGMYEQLLIDLEYDLSVDLDYVIDITYTANLQSWYEGFFGSYYMNEAGEQK